ncbi:hypothetical protein F511_07872 [Dorcoceras hygrometricum]|uniref:Uncharacterized protein n=1 Tax=Dorcoceras hygrometricum TaxID=472368 RepID=A0A2Z7CL82_9LAMI|nr:hypothetical protein F511_07872 [Dorcoceras hygrometricum]
MEISLESHDSVHNKHISLVHQFSVQSKASRSEQCFSSAISLEKIQIGSSCIEQLTAAYGTDYTFVSVVLLGVLAACGLSDRVATGAVGIKSSSGILPVQGGRGYIGV